MADGAPARPPLRPHGPRRPRRSGGGVRGGAPGHGDDQRRGAGRGERRRYRHAAKRRHRARGRARRGGRRRPGRGHGGRQPAHRHEQLGAAGNAPARGRPASPRHRTGRCARLGRGGGRAGRVALDHGRGRAGRHRSLPPGAEAPQSHHLRDGRLRDGPRDESAQQLLLGGGAVGGMRGAHRGRPHGVWTRRRWSMC